MLIPFDPETPEDTSFWYIIAVKNNNILYLHKEGNWQPNCFSPMNKEYSGHYKTKEEAIEVLKFFTSIKVINENETI